MPLIPFYVTFFLFPLAQGQCLSNFWIAVLSISFVQSNHQIFRNTTTLHETLKEDAGVEKREE